MVNKINFKIFRSVLPTTMLHYLTISAILLLAVTPYKINIFQGFPVLFICWLFPQCMQLYILQYVASTLRKGFLKRLSKALKTHLRKLVFPNKAHVATPTILLKLQLWEK